MKCPNCGYQNRRAAQFCQGCGAALPSQDLTLLDTQPIVLPSSPQRPLPLPSSDTRPLSGASIAFAPLPEGALLNNGRYVVLELRDGDAHSNTYLADSVTPIRRCPNCQTEAHNSQERFCSFCGADISEVEPSCRRYVVQERADAQAFALEAQLLNMRLEHPGLLLPHDFFTESPYGPSRRYLVEPEVAPPLATSLSIPQEINQVLKWGISLAQALDYLHNHYVTFREINLNQIAVQDRKAWWTHLGAATIIPPEARALAGSYFVHDVRGLATALAYLAAGPRQDIHAQVPEQAARALSQVIAEPTGFTATAFATALENSLQELRRPTSISLVVGYRTDVGQERSLNEDSLLALGPSPGYRSTGTPVGLFVVADGMGGHSAGDVASRLTVETIEQHAVAEVLPPTTGNGSLPDPNEWLVTTTLAANQQVHDQRKAAGTDMGTTLVMALVVGDMATIANVGDSRAYLLTQNKITQITTDHSLVERLVAAGQITRDEASHHPQRNVIYRVIGDKPHIEVDLFKQWLHIGEALLLCSDGLSGMVPDEQIWQIWRTSTSPQEACDRLVEAANQAGGVDNITVVVVQVEE